jgi:hypothetical protein
VLTDPTSIAMIQVGTRMTELKKLNATDLRVEMIRMGWVLSEIMKPDGKQFKNMKELLEMARGNSNLELLKNKNKKKSSLMKLKKGLPIP